MKNSVFTSVLTMTVVKLDSVNKLATVRLVMDGKSKTLRNVRVSGLLNWRFNNNPLYEVGKNYGSTIASVVLDDNPMQLIVHGSLDAPEYYLECVEVAKSEELVSKDMFGNDLVDYINRYHTPKYFRRYRNYLKSVK